MAQQTAVDWFYQMILPKDTQAVFILAKDIEVLLDQAKEMQKQQIINAAADHCYPTCESARTHAEQYYNETYGDEQRSK
jgi:hypothetical protein